jgi:hypothetical protein
VTTRSVRGVSLFVEVIGHGYPLVVMHGATRGTRYGRRHPVAIAAVKTVHTAVFLVELASIGWLAVSGLLGRRDRTVGMAAGAVAIEAAVFLANDGVCPLTPVAERLGARRGGVSDIFLPDAVARTIPIWSSALLAVAALLHARSAFRPPLAARGRAGDRYPRRATSSSTQTRSRSRCSS